MQLEENITRENITRTNIARRNIPTEESEGKQSSQHPFADEQASDSSDYSTYLEPLEVEALALNMDALLRVYTPHHFFCWTQGLLQNLIRHELLICALHKGKPMSFYVDSFTTAPPSHGVNQAFPKNMSGQNTPFVPQLVKVWELNHFRPVVCEMGKDRLSACSKIMREMNFAGANDIVVHGTYDAIGTATSLFIFVCRPGTVSAKQLHLIELIVPSLHAAWIRAQVSWPEAHGDARSFSGGRDLLTPREKEIMELVYLGKSNIEIGMILRISPLTVKNHVQKILRRLDVQNRTQAVGKALALRIIGE